MKKVWFFLLSAIIFTSLIFLPFKNQVLAEQLKYKIAKVVNVDTCVTDSGGPYTLPECKDALANLKHPGNYKIGKVLGNIDACIQDPNGPYTYSQCQDELLLNSSLTSSINVNPCTGGICETGLGNIPTNTRDFANKILSLAIGLAGGIALILMVIGSIRVLTSSGDQQKLSGGRDQIVAAIAGLLFLIFSVLILRFIGIQILGL